MKETRRSSEEGRLARSGHSGASTQRIAEAGGVTAGLMKHYFTGKSELLLESYRCFRNRELSACRQAAQAATGPEA